MGLWSKLFGQSRAAREKAPAQDAVEQGQRPAIVEVDLATFKVEDLPKLKADVGSHLTLEQVAQNIHDKQCKSYKKQVAVVFGHQHEDMVRALGSFPIPIFNGESVHDLKRKMPEVCATCNRVHSSSWIVQYGLLIPRKSGAPSSEAEVNLWSARFWRMFCDNGGESLLNSQKDRDRTWHWNVSNSSGIITIRLNPGGTTTWLYQVLKLLEDALGNMN